MGGRSAHLCDGRPFPASLLHVSLRALTRQPALPASSCLATSPAVDRVFNGEDLLMNFVLANASLAAGSRDAVEFTRPTVSPRAALVAGWPARLAAAGCERAGDGSSAKGGWPVQAQPACPPPPPPRSQRRLDISKLSGVGISHNWNGFIEATQARLAALFWPAQVGKNTRESLLTRHANLSPAPRTPLPAFAPLQDYLANFTATFGGVPLQTHNFNWGHFRWVGWGRGMRDAGAVP